MKGKTIFITGATSGIGQACARKFAAMGCRLILNGRNLVKLSALEQELIANGVEVLVLAFDVRDREAMRRAVETLPEEWHNIEEKFRNISMTSKDARKFSRFFFAGAAAVELDKQGRILLPPVLREYANLQKDVVLVGVLSRVEIWDKDRWQENTYDEDEMDEIAEHMADLGFSI